MASESRVCPMVGAGPASADALSARVAPASGTSRAACVSELAERKVMCLYKGGSLVGDQVKRVGQAVLDGGAKFVEITISHNDHNEQAAFDTVRTLVDTFGDDLVVGTGTTLTAAEVTAAHDAGSRFVVSPVLDERVLATAHGLDMMTVPGVITPNEVMRGWELGADYLKAFPVGELGVSYAKAVMVPLGFPRYLAVCKMTPENFEDFLKIGFAAASISSSINKRELIEGGQYDEIARRIREYVDIAARYGQQ